MTTFSNCITINLRFFEVLFYCFYINLSFIFPISQGKLFECSEHFFVIHNDSFISFAVTSPPPPARRRCGDVEMTLSVRLNDVAGKSQIKHPTMSRWNATKTSQLYISMTSYLNVVTTSQEDVTMFYH